jgi:hypothetical protein
MCRDQELVREIDDLYNHYFLPVFREWVSRQGDLLPSLPSSGSVTVGSVTWRLEAIDAEIWSEVEKMNCLRTTLDVPSYWEIPLLADKKLCLRGCLKSPDSVVFNRPCFTIPASKQLGGP